MLHLIRLNGSEDRLAALLWHDRKRWLEIRMLLMQVPRRRLLDEPVGAMSGAESARTAELLNEARGRDLTVVVEPGMPLVTETAQQGKVAVLHEGAVVAQDTMAQVKGNARMIDVYFGARNMLSVTAIIHFSDSSHTWRSGSLDIVQARGSALPGHCGVGKMRLLKCLARVLAAAGSKVTLGAQGIMKLKRRQRAAAGVASVPQGRESPTELTVEENLSMGIATRSAPGALRIELEVHQLFPLMQQRWQRRGADLSRSQQQLAIARALLAQLKRIISDEPAEGIRPLMIKEIERVLRLLKQRGDMGMLRCEHCFGCAHALAERFIALMRGKVTAVATQARMGSKNVRQHLAV